MGKVFEIIYKLSLVLPAVVGAVREVYYALRTVKNPEQRPTVSPLWPEKMDGKGSQTGKRGYSSPVTALLGSWWILAVLLLLSALLAVSGCGTTTSLIPVACQVDVYAPDSATVVLDGLVVGQGIIEDLVMFENYPNYLRIWSDSLDVRLILVSCPGLEGIGVR